ncbi:protein ndrg4 isoform x1 [Limosa lapponica baueri]|uniref:Protein ndrg4 isoform x1 n=1 Tax=Limosa lapponica baueri TaxID=1758121 RepID=A0A2I0U8J5_LIMLA|nr:protein ndrg4 isoform x1 [Limosa lapponica baueri]
MTMAGLNELRFTEEKPLLRGQDAELENSDVFLSTVDTDWKMLLPWDLGALALLEVWATCQSDGLVANG